MSVCVIFGVIRIHFFIHSVYLPCFRHCFTFRACIVVSYFVPKHFSFFISISNSTRNDAALLFTFHSLFEFISCICRKYSRLLCCATSALCVCLSLCTLYNDISSWLSLGNMHIFVTGNSEASFNFQNHFNQWRFFCPLQSPLSASLWRIGRHIVRNNSFAFRW